MVKPTAHISLRADGPWGEGHVTLIWFGDVTNYPAAIKDEIITSLNNLPNARVQVFKGKHVGFGPKRNTDVLLLNGPYIRNIRHTVAMMMRRLGLEHASKWEFNPHLTLHRDKHHLVPETFDVGPLQFKWMGERVIIPSRERECSG